MATRKRARSNTVLRNTLREDSALQDAVREGLGAVQTGHRNYFDEQIRTTFDDSLDLDEASRPGHEQENRWDYLLGHAPSGEVVAVEPHSAKQDEISRIIRKKRAAEQYLRGHLRDAMRVTRWLWVASGRVQFAETERARLRLDQEGIQFVGTQVAAKYLPSAKSTGRPRRRSRRS
jgi:hypothetical protein